MSRLCAHCAGGELRWLCVRKMPPTWPPWPNSRRVVWRAKSLTGVFQGLLLVLLLACDTLITQRLRWGKPGAVLAGAGAPPPAAATEKRP